MPARDGEVSPPEPEEERPTLANCLRMFPRFHSLESLFEAYPDFRITNQWAIERRPFGAASEIGRIRCIQGASLRMYCGLHKAVKRNGKSVPCKCIVTIGGDFVRAQVILVLWLMAGISVSIDAHLDDVQPAYELWRNR